MARPESAYTMDILKEYDISNMRHLYNKAGWAVKSLRRQCKHRGYDKQNLFAQLRLAEMARDTLGQMIVDMYQHTLCYKEQGTVDMTVNTPMKVFDKCDIMITIIPKDK